MLHMVKISLIANIFFLFTEFGISSPLIINHEKYGSSTCVYYTYGSTVFNSCHTVRSDVNREGWNHSYGDVSCNYNCGKCSHLYLSSYIYDKYGEKWKTIAGWSGQKISIKEKDQLIDQITPYLLPGGFDLESVKCSPEAPCGQFVKESQPLIINSQTYGDNTCVYYDYSIRYDESGHTLRGNKINDEGWLHYFGDVTCEYNCTNHYYLDLTTYIYDKNAEGWKVFYGWTGQKIDARDACKLLEQIKVHRKPLGSIDSISCTPYIKENNFGSQCNF